MLYFIACSIGVIGLVVGFAIGFSSRGVIHDSNLAKKSSSDASSSSADFSSGDFAGKQAGQEWSQNTLNMKMCWCPAGQFTMGSPESEIEYKSAKHRKNESQAQVTLTRGFWMGKYEVTQADWAKVMGTTIRQQREIAMDVRRQRLRDGGKDPADLNMEQLRGEGPEYPMYYVSYSDTVKFCMKVTIIDHNSGHLPSNWEYRLPTEAQWEYACRAGTSTATAFGDSLSAEQANFDRDAPYNGGKQLPAQKLADQGTRPVGSYKANSWGLHDMHGNVDEWCRDWLDDDHFEKKLPGGRDPEATSGSKYRATRGGYWLSNGRDCRSASRNGSYPDHLGDNIGFRIAAVHVK